MRKTAWTAAALGLVVAATAWWLLDDSAEVSVDGVGEARRVESDGLAVDEVAETVAGNEDARELEAAGEVDEVSTPTRARSPYHAALTERVTARVIDLDGKPVEGASFRLESNLSLRGSAYGAASPAISFEAITDAEGRVEFAVDVDDALALGQYSTTEIVSVSKPGFACVVRALEAAKIASLELGEITLQPSVPLIGRVVGVDGQPIAGARVRVREENGRDDNAGNLTATSLMGHAYYPEYPASTATDADGRFAFHDLQPRYARLDVDAEGYAPRATRSFHVPPFDASNGPTDCGEIILDAGRVIRGVVLTPERQPVVGATVLVAPRSANHWLAWLDGTLPDGVRAATTDGSGSYAIEGASPDEVRLRAFKLDVGRSKSHKVSREDSVVDVELPGAVESLYACVDDATGDPVVVDDLVAFKFRVPESPFLEGEEPLRLRAARNEVDPAVWSITCPGGVAPLVRVRALGYDEMPEKQDEELRLVRRAELRVFVQDEEGVPIAGSVVWVERPSSRRNVEWETTLKGYTGFDGVVQLSGVDVGKCRVTAVDGRHGRQSVECDVTDAGEGVTLTLARTPRLVVHVRDSESRPVPAGCLQRARRPQLARWLGEPDTSWRSSEVLNDDRFEYLHRFAPSWIAPGTFECSGLGPGNYRVVHEPGGFVDVEVVGELIEVELVTRRWPHASGVVQSRGTPIAGARVTFESPGEREQRMRPALVSYAYVLPPHLKSETRTDAAGRWEMDVMPGEQYVTVTTPSGVISEVLEVFSYDERRVVTHKLDLTPISGTVVDDRGQPIAGAVVAASDSMTGFTLRQLQALDYGNAIIKEVVSDDQGRFSIVSEADQKNVVAQHPDYQRMESPAVAEPRDDVRVTLARGTRVTVLIQDELGERLFLRRKGWNKFLCRMERVDEEAHVSLEDSREMSEYTSRALPPGRYRAWVERKYGKPRQLLAETFIDITDTSAVSVVLTVPGL